VSAEETEALVRIAREAVSNAARHGSPRSIDVTLGPGRLVVEDDGTGFDPTATSGGVGLVGMRERIELLDGSLTVEASPTSGTTIAAEVPA
jgi:signal transduction histidine kinase